MSFSLYVHIPYCQTKCVYCDFNSHPDKNHSWMHYLQSLILEWNYYKQHPMVKNELETIFFGGGTPSIFPPEFFKLFLKTIKDDTDYKKDIEITMECNPGTVQTKKLEEYKGAGINRLSIGVQSFNDEYLKTLTRIHSSQDAIKTILSAEKAGFKDLSIDLMFGIPGQTIDDWKNEIEKAVSFALSHISVYNLTPEEGTLLKKYVQTKKLDLPSEDIQVEEYKYTRNFLRSHGFTPYEISNYSKNKPCMHNIQYWTGKNYLGLGAGAHSFSLEYYKPEKELARSKQRIITNNISNPVASRWANIKKPELYMKATKENNPPIEFIENLSVADRLTESLITFGRLSSGFDLNYFEKNFGSDVKDALIKSSQKYIELKWLVQNNNNIEWTDEGILLANTVIRNISIELDVFFP